MTSPLLAVKFFIPRLRPGLTERPHLVSRFAAGLERSLTLISAPAGFGKSTLISTWIDRQRNGPGAATIPGPRFDAIAWLSLDSADNAPRRFWSYVVAALQAGLTGAPSPGPRARDGAPLEPILELLQADPPPPVLPVLDSLINEITRGSDLILLVLDDYHAIQSPAVHEQVAYLLEHLPPNLRLVIATRADPPLPVPRLRARGQLSEFRAADLRFTAAEAAQFLKGMLGLELSVEEVQTIEESTEGWIAGLQMAALAMQAQVAGQEAGEETDPRERIREFIASFSGKHVFVLDYLADEVFNRQPENIQQFLLKTSILDQLCAPLCDALLESRPQDLASPDDSRVSTLDSRSTLEHLERMNLFLLPLDDHRQWYRYHHLFADLLRVRLDQTWPGLMPELHVRASAWFERSSLIEEAINHALAASDWDRAARLMEQHIQAFLERGQLSKIMDWIGLLPEEVARRRPRLTIQQVWVMGFAQRIKEFAPLLESARQSIEALYAGLSGRAPAEAAEILGLKANLILMQAYYAIMTGKPDQTLERLQELESILPPDAYAWERSWMHWMAGYAHRSSSRLDRAADEFREALRIIREQGGSLWNDMICCTDLAMVCHLQGKLNDAREHYRQALELGKERRAVSHGYLNRVEAGLSAVLLDLNELEEAARRAETALEWSQRWPSANARALAMTALARVRLAQGDPAGAAEVLHQADRERRKWPLLPVNDSLVETGLVRLWLAQGDRTAARQWAKAVRETMGPGLEPGEVASEGMEMKWIALVRVLAAEGQANGDTGDLDEALSLLESLEVSTQKSGRVHASIEAGMLRAVVLQARAQRQDGRTDAGALAALENSLALAQAGGYIRVFVDAGQAVEAMVKAIRSRHDPIGSVRIRKEYLDTLLRAFPGRVSDRERKQAVGMVEPLTDRELDVLRLLAQGLSNREIAEKLFVSEGTVKTHVHNLIGKLEAQSRTQAIARGKELGVI